MGPIEEAELAVVAEIFRRLPGMFVWIGGSVLRLLHKSPRVSHDIDLVPQAPAPGADVPRIVSEALSPVNETLGLHLEVDRIEQDDGMFRIRIKGPDQISFSIDVTRIAGSIRATQQVLVRAATGTAAVMTPTDSCLLAAKVRALLQRRFVKPGDLFDVWFLLNEGVKLDPEDRTALEDELIDVDQEAILERFQRFDGEAWTRALTRSGVGGLTKETGARMTQTVRRFVSELVA